MIWPRPPPPGPGRARGWSARAGPGRGARLRHGTRGVARPPPGRRPGCWRRVAIQVRAGSRSTSLRRRPSRPGRTCPGHARNPTACRAVATRCWPWPR